MKHDRPPCPMALCIAGATLCCLYLILGGCVFVSRKSVPEHDAMQASIPHSPMNPEVIQTDLAPAAIGPYSQAIRLGDLLFCSGQIALDPKSGELVGTTAGEQVEQVLTNLAAVLEAGGTDVRGTRRCGFSRWRPRSRGHLHRGAAV